MLRAAVPWIGGAFSSVMFGLGVPRAMAQGVTTNDMGLGASRPMSKRWTEQRWALDSIIQANGVDWDQPRSQYWNAVCGLEAAPDFARIRQRVKKYADIKAKAAAAGLMWRELTANVQAFVTFPEDVTVEVMELQL